MATDVQTEEVTETPVEWSGATKALDLSTEDGAREVTARISNSDVDRDGEVMLAAGLKQAKSSVPVVFGHNISDPAMVLGKTVWIRKNPNGRTASEVLAKLRFNDSPNGELVFGLLKSGDLDSFSHRHERFEQSRPTENELRRNPDWAGADNIVRSWSILEVSVVPIPANPSAIALSVSKGLLDLDCEVGEQLRADQAFVEAMDQVKDETPKRQSQVFIREPLKQPVIRAIGHADTVLRDVKSVDWLDEIGSRLVNEVRQGIVDRYPGPAVKSFLDRSRGKV